MEFLGTVLVTGGAGYVGAVLVPKLLGAGYRVRVLDRYWFGKRALAAVQDHPGLEQTEGDIRDQPLLRRLLRDCDAVIHLACIANDPSFELNPELGRAINFAAFRPLVKIARLSGVRRFIFASTSSVYGVSDAPSVTEDHPLVPITDYSKYKQLCEPILLEQQCPEFTAVVIRPATVCGYSPRQRLDLTVNILTNHAINLGRITVLGGTQMRPNIHIEDITDLYLKLVQYPDRLIAGQIFNAGYDNQTVAEIAHTVREVVSREIGSHREVEIVATPSDDLRSYRICSEKIRRVLAFEPKRSVADGVRDLVTAFAAGKLPDPLDNPRYYNIRTMRTLAA